MKIGIYSPYLDTFGGGERYVLTIAECLSADHQVDLLIDTHLKNLDSQKLKKRLSSLLNLDLSRVETIEAPLGKGSSFWQRIKFLKIYDWLFYLTDGSIFYSTAKKNILHFQVPLKNIQAKGMWGKKKLSTWEKIIFNSKFTKEYIEPGWGIKGEVIYPPVDVEAFKALTKTKTIVSVGRFFDFLHSKKQDVLVAVFSKMVKKGLRGWKLQLAGGTNKEGKKYLQKIKSLSKGLPVEFYEDISFKDLQQLYGKASIYWHAAGFAENDPKRKEHFGITTVEAMSAGAVPVVINSGGQKEIVEHQKSGFLWNTIRDLENYTMRLIRDNNLWKRLSKNAAERSKIFSKEQFCYKIKKIMGEQ